MTRVLVSKLSTLTAFLLSGTYLHNVILLSHFIWVNYSIIIWINREKLIIYRPQEDERLSWPG